MSKGKTKYTVTFPFKISKILDEISETECISKPEVLKRAIALYSYVRKEIEAGNTIQILDESDNIKEIVFQ